MNKKAACEIRGLYYDDPVAIIINFDITGSTVKNQYREYRIFHDYFVGYIKELNKAYTEERDEMIRKIKEKHLEESGYQDVIDPVITACDGDGIKCQVYPFQYPQSILVSVLTFPIQYLERERNTLSEIAKSWFSSPSLIYCGFGISTRNLKGQNACTLHEIEGFAFSMAKHSKDRHKRLIEKMEKLVVHPALPRTMVSSNIVTVDEILNSGEFLISNILNKLIPYEDKELEEIIKHWDRLVQAVRLEMDRPVHWTKDLKDTRKFVFAVSQTTIPNVSNDFVQSISSIYGKRYDVNRENLSYLQAKSAVKDTDTIGRTYRRLIYNNKKLNRMTCLYFHGGAAM